MLRIFDIYLLKNLLVATVFIAVTLAFIVFLTQSLRFLEIVINAGAGSSFWILTALALPRFLEVILPLSMLASVLFLYNKMMLDSELVAIRAAGKSHLALAKPADGAAAEIKLKRLARVEQATSEPKSEIAASEKRERVLFVLEPATPAIHATAPTRYAADWTSSSA